MTNESNRAVFNIHIRGTIDAVWREITKTDEIQKCMFNSRLEASTLGVGGKMRMVSASGKYAGVVGEIIEWDPPRRYAHTFRFTNYDDPECVVRYELEEGDGGVDFTRARTVGILSPPGWVAEVAPDLDGNVPILFVFRNFALPGVSDGR